MTSENSLHTATKTNLPSLYQNNDGCRQRRRRAQHSGCHSGGGAGAGLITAAVAALSLGFGRGNSAANHAAAARHDYDGRLPPSSTMADRDGRSRSSSSSSSSSPRNQQWRHVYDPLNATKIELSPVLSDRYRWVRQSPALGRLLDDNINMAAGDVLLEGYYGRTGVGNSKRQLQKEQQQQPEPQQRHLDGSYYDYDDAYSNVYADDASNSAAAYYADDAAASDDASAASDDDYQQTIKNICEDKTCTVNEQCTKFLFGFLEGTTDAKDNCEGIMNAYVAADCGTIRKKTDAGGTKADATIYNMDDDFNDDYFGIFYDHQCCSSLRSHYYEYCDSTELLNGYNLLVIAGVMLLCECAKSVVKKNRIRWLPEAASCMLVGMAVALGAGLLGTNVENIGFDEEIFMYLLLPPIIFEAALTVNKREFRRRRGAIMVFAVFGTLLSSFVTGAATYYTAKYLGNESLSILDSLVFGSLISSIDPVAILSVLTSLKMSETDTIYILVFGESLLNDGIAITLFKSLVSQYESTSAISVDDILGSIADFLIIAFGSCAIGLACGVACLCYFHLNSSILHPVMEVASFFLWAVVPYWMAEAFGWSGIVAIVVMGFFMDIYLRPGWDQAELELEEERRQLMLAAAASMQSKTGLGIGGSDSKIDLRYYNWDDDDDGGRFRFRGTAVDIPRPYSAPLPPPAEILHGREGSEGSRTSKANNLTENDADTVAGTSMTTNPNIKAILLKREFVRMSREADEHVRFVAHILSSLSENAIFAYLGLFLFSSKYEWDAILCSIGVVSCILSRALMVVFASWFIWYMHVFRQRAGCQSNRMTTCLEEDLDTKPSKDSKVSSNKDSNDMVENEDDKHAVDPLNTPISKSARALSNYKVQVVLILAGLRGAVSLALVESVPIYNGVTGVGSKNKPLLKAMTSSAIIFTIFILGGGAYYILKWLDISSDDMLIKSTSRPGPRGAYGGYLYPPLVCGGYPSSDAYAPEMELATTPSWGVGRGPWMELTGSRLGSIGRQGSPRIGGHVPPLISRSRSDWSHTSGYSAGLNDIADRQLRLSRTVSASTEPAAGRSRSMEPMDSSPGFPTHIV